MGVVTAVALAVLALAALLCLVRMVVGPSLADRMVAGDALLLVALAGVTTAVFHTRSGVYVDLLVLAALVTFLGTAAIGRFIEQRGS